MGAETGSPIKVLVVGVGGTIASVPTARGLSPSLSILEVVRRATGGTIPKRASIFYEDLMRIDSSLMSPKHWVDIARAIHNAYENYDAFLVLQGTDTMAYTASALSLILRGLKKPVVLTGSMKSVVEEDSDAPGNVRTSLEFIWEAVKREISGVFLVFNNKVIWGVRASKINTAGLDAFASINYPLVATADENGITIRHVPKRVFTCQRPGLDEALNDNIVVLKAFPGMRPKVLDVAISSGVEGVILEAFGLGGLSQELVEKLGDLSERIPVVITTQSTFGGVDMKVYEVGRRLLDTGVIPACDMSKECATVKLMWSLGKTRRVDEVRTIFLKSFEDEIVPCL